MRVGYITNSFGRLINLLAVVLRLEADPSLCKECADRLSDTLWFFPGQYRFPYLAEVLSSRIRVSKIQSLGPYKLATKTKFLSKFTTSSTDDFNHLSDRIYTEPFPSQFLNMRPEAFERIPAELINFEHSTRPIVGIYARDSFWDVNTSGIRYAATQEFRNFYNQSTLQKLVQNLISLGFNVVRLGRANSKLFSSPKEFFYDYAFDHERANDFLDLFIWSKIRFAIATVGGACQPGFFFGKPFLFWDYGENPSQIMNQLSAYPHGKLILLVRENDHYKNGSKINDISFLHDSIDYLLHQKDFVFNRSGVQRQGNFLIIS